MQEHISRDVEIYLEIYLGVHVGITFAQQKGSHKARILSKVQITLGSAHKGREWIPKRRKQSDSP